MWGGACVVCGQCSCFVSFLRFLPSVLYVCQCPFDDACVTAANCTRTPTTRTPTKHSTHNLTHSSHSQVQSSLLAGRRQLGELQRARQQQEQEAAQLSRDVSGLRSERSAAAEEAHSAQQELQRVLRELEQCQKVGCCGGAGCAVAGVVCCLSGASLCCVVSAPTGQQSDGLAVHEHVYCL